MENQWSRIILLVSAVSGLDLSSTLHVDYVSLHLAGFPARHPVDDLLGCDGDNVDRQASSGCFRLSCRLDSVIDHTCCCDLIRPRRSVFLYNFIPLLVCALTNDRLVSEAILNGVVREFNELRVC